MLGAWMLLSVLCLQRVISLLGFEVTYILDSSRHMSYAERVIAQDIRDATGVDHDIRILFEDDKHSIHAIGYSAPLVCTAEFEGQKVEYTFAKTPNLTLEYIKLNDLMPEDNDQPAEVPQFNKNKLFSDFQLSESAPVATPDVHPHSQRFQYLDLFSDPYLHILVPPPRMV